MNTLAAPPAERSAEVLQAKPLTRSPWARGCWTVYLDNEEAVRRAILYVEQNPVKDGLRPQKWSFVVPYK